MISVYIYILCVQITLNRSSNLLQDDNEETSIKEYDERMQLYIDHTTRMSVLTGIAGIFTLICFVIWLIFFKEEDEAQGGQGVTFEFLNTSWWLIPMDALINALCLFLNLPFLFAYDIYRKICCCCHQVCNGVCLAVVGSMVKNAYDADLKVNPSKTDVDGRNDGGLDADEKVLMTNDNTE